MPRSLVKRRELSGVRKHIALWLAEAWLMQAIESKIWRDEISQGVRMMRDLNRPHRMRKSPRPTAPDGIGMNVAHQDRPAASRDTREFWQARRSIAHGERTDCDISDGVG